MPPRPRTGVRRRPDLPFRFIGGHPALDLINTVDWTRHGAEDERMTDYDRFVEFAEGAGIIDEKSGRRLRRIAARDPDEAKRALHRAHAFRDALQRIVQSIIVGSLDGRARARAIDELNDVLESALAQLRLRVVGAAVVLQWTGSGEALESPLWPIAWSAAQLLASDERSQLRVCAAPDCGWVYVDRSRNRLRRWCQMETCGNRAKAARRYAREASRDT